MWSSHFYEKKKLWNIFMLKVGGIGSKNGNYLLKEDKRGHSSFWEKFSSLKNTLERVVTLPNPAKS